MSLVPALLGISAASVAGFFWVIAVCAVLHFFAGSHKDYRP